MVGAFQSAWTHQLCNTLDLSGLKKFSAVFDSNRQSDYDLRHAICQRLRHLGSLVKFTTRPRLNGRMA